MTELQVQPTHSDVKAHSQLQGKLKIQYYQASIKLLNETTKHTCSLASLVNACALKISIIRPTRSTTGLFQAL